jgi:hypothetical protein
VASFFGQVIRAQHASQQQSAASSVGKTKDFSDPAIIYRAGNHDEVSKMMIRYIEAGKALRCFGLRLLQ